MAELLQQAIARVRGSATAPIAGTAFLISERHVMTCAHVVNVALGRAWEATDPPGADTVQIEFPFARHTIALTATMVEWRPPGAGGAADIAILELDREVAERPYRTTAGLPHRGQIFWTKGFPEGQDGGMDAAGELGTPIEHGRLLAHGNALPGFFIEGGFSGAPLLDEVSNAVIGMAAAATRDAARRTAFVIPADQLELAWPPLARPYKGLNNFREQDRRFFFGRDVYVEELAAKLARVPFVAVVGRSGSGKSSLVRAGLLPRLHEAGVWRILVVRPGAPSADPFRTWRSACSTPHPARAPVCPRCSMRTRSRSLHWRCATMNPWWSSICDGLAATPPGKPRCCSWWISSRNCSPWSRTRMRIPSQVCGRVSSPACARRPTRPIRGNPPPAA
jgi:hypothetical protein